MSSTQTVTWEKPAKTGEKFIDKTGEEERKERVTSKSIRALRDAYSFTGVKEQEANKGVWRMPWLPEMTKDVVSCEKLRGGANDL